MLLGMGLDLLFFEITSQKVPALATTGPQEFRGIFRITKHHMAFNPSVWVLCDSYHSKVGDEQIILLDLNQSCHFTLGH